MCRLNGAKEFYLAGDIHLKNNIIIWPSKVEILGNDDFFSISTQVAKLGGKNARKTNHEAW